ncbi:MAG: helix-turn-helix domain-containing protein [archaeon]
MQESDIKTLEQTGLTHAQAKIYLTLLELGQTKIGVIIEKTQLQSSVVHNNINKLIDNGLVNFVMMGKIKQYHVAEPMVFLNFLEEQKQKIDENKKEIAKIIPRLKLIKEQTKNKSEIEVFKGRMGFKTAYIEEYEKLERNEPMQFLAMPEEFQKDDELHNVFIQINKIALEKNCKIQGIGSESMRKIWAKNYGGQKIYDFKYLKEDFPWDVNILKDVIMISIWGDEPIVIKVKNRKFRDNAHRYFLQKWAAAKK